MPRKYNRMGTCTVCDSGLKESTLACKFKRLCTIPDGGPEKSTVPVKFK